jgi:ABC-2 type transport system permease protein
MIRRIASLVVKEFIHLRRDWWMPAFMIFGGLLELLLVGWATSRPITNLPMLVLDHDMSAASREVLTALENTTTFDLQSPAPDLETIERALDRGQINAAIVIPSGFSAEMASASGEPELFVLLNGAESIAAIEALRAVEGLAMDMGGKLAMRRLGLSEEVLAGFNPSVRVWFNEALSEALFTVPAELALMLEFTILIFAALSFARERELGTLEQLLVMPFSSLEIIIGKSIPAVLISFVDILIMIFLVQVAFSIPMRGSLALLLLLALGYIFVELGKGLVISVISRTQHQAFLLVFLIGFIDLMFTGYAIPVESMPTVMRVLANLVPAHHWLAIFRAIMLKGVGLEVLWPNVLALAALGLVIGSFSIGFVRRALD